MFSWIIFSLLHLSLFYSVNLVNKIWQCAFIFSLVWGLTAYMAKHFDLRKAFQTSCLSLCLNLLFTFDAPYVIGSKTIHGLYTASSLAMFCSLMGGLWMMKTLSRRIPAASWSFLSALSLVAISLFDGAAMMGFLTSFYPLSKLSLIFFKEVGFKTLYAGLFFSLSCAWSQSHPWRQKYGMISH